MIRAVARRRASRRSSWSKRPSWFAMNRPAARRVVEMSVAISSRTVSTVGNVETPVRRMNIATTAFVPTIRITSATMGKWFAGGCVVPSSMIRSIAAIAVTFAPRGRRASIERASSIVVNRRCATGNASIYSTIAPTAGIAKRRVRVMRCVVTPIAPRHAPIATK